MAAEISSRPRGAAPLGVNLASDLDLGLIEILGSRPPIERRVGGHDHIVRAPRFSDGGQTLYSVGWDKKLKVWPLADADPAPNTLDTHAANIHALAYHGDSQILVSTDEAGVIKLWDLKGMEPSLLGTLNENGAEHAGWVAAAALSPDGRWLATAGHKGRIVLWDLSNPAQPKQESSFGKSVHQTEIYRLAYIERGPWAGALVSADWDGKISIWRAPQAGSKDSREPDLKRSATNAVGGPVAIFSLAASPSGIWLAAGDYEGAIHAWDLASATLPPESEELRFPDLLAHRGIVFDMDFSPDSSHLATVGADGVLLQWAIPSTAKTAAAFAKGLRVKRFAGWGEKLHSVAYRPGPSPGLAVGGAKTIWLADPSRPNPLAARLDSVGVDATDHGWSAIAATPDLSFVAALGKREIARWGWDGEDYQAQPGLPIEAEWGLSRIALSGDGGTLVGLSCEGRTAVWSLEMDPVPAPVSYAATAEEYTMKKKGCAVAVAFAPHGEAFATGVGPFLRLWSQDGTGAWRSGDPFRAEDLILALAFSPKGDRLAAAGRFDRILMWEIAAGRLSDSPWRSQDKVDQTVLALAFDPDGTRLVSGGDDAVAIDWALPALSRRPQAALHDRRLTGLAFGQIAGDSVLFSGDAEGQLVLCSGVLRDEGCARVGTANGQPIDGLAGNPDLSRLLVLNGGLWISDLRRESMLEKVKLLTP